jgi:2-dehydro-3-deoxyphosphogluconate aldolase/(4S)-4-hydroxy-2-oxoglutarate aldolase
MNPVVERVLKERVVGILRAESPDMLMEVAGALREGGLRCLEFTMTTPGALDLIREGTRAFGDDILLGAGTVLDPETARAVILAGAKFVVTPVVRPEVIQMCRRYGVPVMPGAFTATEILTAWEAGGDIIKVFPCGRVGPEYLKDVRGPLPQIPMMPTGGIAPEQAADFLKAGAVAVGIGGKLTNLGPGESPAALTERAKRLMESIQEV